MIIKSIRKMYDKTLELSKHPRAVLYLMLVSFSESIFFPIPQDVMLVPMMLANKSKAFYFATMALIASVLGGVAGYFVGAYLFNEIAMPILELYGYMPKMEALKEMFIQYGWWIVVVGGLTPVPYKVITITSGAMGLSLPVFIAAAIVSRAMRFYLLAFLTYLLGDKILEFVDKYFASVTILAMVLLVGGFALVKVVL